MTLPRIETTGALISRKFAAIFIAGVQASGSAPAGSRLWTGKTAERKCKPAPQRPPAHRNGARSFCEVALPWPRLTVFPRSWTSEFPEAHCSSCTLPPRNTFPDEVLATRYCPRSSVIAFPAMRRYIWPSLICIASSRISTSCTGSLYSSSTSPLTIAAGISRTGIFLTCSPAATSIIGWYSRLRSSEKNPCALAPSADRCQAQHS